jgi:quercetin dioxygenase-like cupin family protein
MKRFITTGSANRLEAEVLKQMDYTNLEEIEEKELVSGFKVRFIHSENMTFSFWNIEKGAQLPEHSHPHEQVTHIIEGRFELTVDGESKKLGPGSVVIILPHAVHSGKALAKSRVIDVFYPIREDYR